MRAGRALLTQPMRSSRARTLHERVLGQSRMPPSLCRHRYRALSVMPSCLATAAMDTPHQRSTSTSRSIESICSAVNRPLLVVLSASLGFRNARLQLPTWTGSRGSGRLRVRWRTPSGQIRFSCGPRLRRAARRGQPGSWSSGRHNPRHRKSPCLFTRRPQPPSPRSGRRPSAQLLAARVLRRCAGPCCPARQALQGRQSATSRSLPTLPASPSRSAPSRSASTRSRPRRFPVWSAP